MSPQVKSNRDRIQQLRNAVPFQPFRVRLVSGLELAVEHPENLSLATHASPQRQWLLERFTVYTEDEQVDCLFGAVEAVVLLDPGRAIN
jgi:hypothetical protein